MSKGSRIRKPDWSIATWKKEENESTVYKKIQGKFIFNLKYIQQSSVKWRSKTIIFSNIEALKNFILNVFFIRKLQKKAFHQIKEEHHDVEKEHWIRLTGHPPIERGKENLQDSPWPQNWEYAWEWWVQMRIGQKEPGRKI